MNVLDPRHLLGCRAVGMLAGLVKSGVLDSVPTVKAMALELELEWEATFVNDKREPE